MTNVPHDKNVLLLPLDLVLREEILGLKLNTSRINLVLPILDVGGSGRFDGREVLHLIFRTKIGGVNSELNFHGTGITHDQVEIRVFGEEGKLVMSRSF